MDELLKIISRFAIKGEPVCAVPYGKGHINRTYKVTAQDDAGTYYYILQRINDKVFLDVYGLMRNISRVSAHILTKLATQALEGEKGLTIICTKQGTSYLKDVSGYYRVYDFISEGISIESAENLKQLELGGKGIGRFQRLLAGFDASLLQETIPNFHNTPQRYKDFCLAVDADIAGRKKNCQEVIDFFISRAHYAPLITNALQSGTIPSRVTHNDGKLNNVLIDPVNLKYVAVIDLDTVMPGASLYDLGDSVRFGASTGAEDEQDLSKVEFSLDAFAAILKGYLAEVASMLTQGEQELLPIAGLLMTYECGMRFLADYLNGDTYFAVHKEGHNLHRAKTQMKLVADMEKKMQDIKAIVQNEMSANLVKASYK